MIITDKFDFLFFFLKNSNIFPLLQLFANVMLYLCAAIVGVMSFYMADRKYRTAFLEARQSLQVKLTLEEQSTQQVRGGQQNGFY